MVDTGARDQLLAIDVGTQSVRALLFNPAGELLHKAQVQMEPYRSEQPGWAEQPADFFWDNLCAACRQLWQQEGTRPDAVAGVALTTQRGTVINVDAEGRPLRPAIIWLDQRRAEGMPRVGGLWGLLLALSGMSGTVAYLQGEAEVNWIRANQPQLWDRTHKYLFLSGYLTHRLIGRYADSVGCQVGYMPFDYKQLRWAKPGGLNDKVAFVEREKLAELLPPGQLLGEITPAAAEQTGIPAGLPLVAAAADKACEVLGSGCLEPEVACLSFGTTATVNTTSRRYVEAIPLIPPYPAAVPDAYNVEIQIYRGYWMVSWFKREFGLREAQLAAERGCAPEALFDELVEQVPPGAMGLTLLPYWSPGLKIPGPEAKGAIIGFGDVHKRAHVYRAILEGLAYGLRQGLERTEKRVKVPVREVRISGGGSQSDAAMQITADIFNRPASRPHLYETSGLGAAMDAAVGLGLHRDFEAAIRAMTRVGRTFEPRLEVRETYERLYRRVYCRIYERLRPLYNEIRGITGYPP